MYMQHVLCGTPVPLVCGGCASNMRWLGKEKAAAVFFFFPPLSASILQRKSQVQNGSVITRVEKYKLCIWCRVGCTMHNSMGCCYQLKTGEMKMSISCLSAQMGELLTSKVSLLQALILRAWPQFAY